MYTYIRIFIDIDIDRVNLFISGRGSSGCSNEDGGDGDGGGDVLSSCVGWTRCTEGSDGIECLHPGWDNVCIYIYIYIYV